VKRGKVGSGGGTGSSKLYCSTIIVLFTAGTFMGSQIIVYNIYSYPSVTDTNIFLAFIAREHHNFM